jgi:hypothetical protein
MLWGNPKSIDRIDRSILYRGKSPAKHPINRHPMRCRYPRWQAVAARLRAVTEDNTERSTVLQTSILSTVRAMRSVFL